MSYNCREPISSNIIFDNKIVHCKVLTTPAMFSWNVVTGYENYADKEVPPEMKGFHYKNVHVLLFTLHLLIHWSPVTVVYTYHLTN